MEAAGGIEYLVRIAAQMIRKSPRHVTIIAPLVAYLFTFLAGTGHVFYPLLPVIYEVAMKGGVRPERPIAVATIASQQAITASPVSAATAALIAILGSQGIGLPQILMICVPSTLIGVTIAALIQTRVGVELEQDPEYQRRLAAGELEAVPTTTEEAQPAGLPDRAGLSAGMFLAGVGVVVCCGLFPTIRGVGPPDDPVTVSMPMTI
jgi:anaerobic C4-dicarboxylate transporter DcuA